MVQSGTVQYRNQLGYRMFSVTVAALLTSSDLGLDILLVTQHQRPKLQQDLHVFLQRRPGPHRVHLVRTEEVK